MAVQPQSVRWTTRFSLCVESAELKASGEFYQATIPGAYIDARYDLIYYVEAVDQFGNATFYPDPDRSLPYVVVKVSR